MFFRPLPASSLRYAPYQQRKWARFADPGERIPPLSPGDKWRFWLREEVRPVSALPALLSAGYGQLTNLPAYGSDEGGFGEKLGAAVLRQASMRFFVDSLFPAITGEDPRYYRKASGTWKSRGGWAAERAFVNQRDKGTRGFNISDLFGHLAASALILAYYPHRSANFGIVMLTWGTSIAGTAGNNEILEFWPDIVNRWVRHRETRELARHLHDNIRQ